MFKGKRKSQWNNSSTVEEDQLKVMHYVTFLCVVFIHIMASFTGLITGLSFVTDCKVSVCRSYCKTSNILNYNIRMRWKHQKTSHWGKSHKYLFDRRMGEFQSQSEHSREETISASARNWTVLDCSCRKMFIVYCIGCWRNWVYDAVVSSPRNVSYVVLVNEVSSWNWHFVS